MTRPEVNHPPLTGWIGLESRVRRKTSDLASEKRPLRLVDHATIYIGEDIIPEDSPPGSKARQDHFDELKCVVIQCLKQNGVHVHHEDDIEVYAVNTSAHLEVSPRWGILVPEEEAREFLESLRSMKTRLTSIESILEKELGLERSK